ncbi:RNA polymerase sigma factor [Frondihabitans cladoniiphilus]|uniref:Sigma-70 family RNA polymerase sigma factor n=1 Tax=Frondihabitans cladoniiphilus TaxID=715785 RepID=A0ABP8W6B2_9MICO
MDDHTRDQTDWALAVEGDGKAFGRVFDRHAARLHRHAVPLVPTPVDADDVVALVFLEAWRKRTTVRFVDGSLLPWLLVTATNSAHNLSRGHRRYRSFLSRFPVDEPVPDPADGLANREGEAIDALRMLAVADQRILTLCLVEGLGEREAATVLGVAPGTVKSRLHRAKARLQKQYLASIPPLGGLS